MSLVASRAPLLFKNNNRYQIVPKFLSTGNVQAAPVPQLNVW